MGSEASETLPYTLNPKPQTPQEFLGQRTRAPGLHVSLGESYLGVEFRVLLRFRLYTLNPHFIGFRGRVGSYHRITVGPHQYATPELNTA